MATQYGSLPFIEQILFFLDKTSVPTARWTDLWQDAHDTGFMAAGAYQADLLADLRQAVTQAITQGTTLETFRKNFDAIVATHGWEYKGGRDWRTRVIYETNLRTSFAAGRYAQLQAVKQDRPYWRYRHTPFEENPRPQHVAWNGLILHADDPWWHTHAPPNGWGCKCYIEAISAEELGRFGKSAPDSAPQDGTYQWTDPATGAVHDVPVGIDPGWAYAPGATTADRLRRLIEAKAREGLPPELGAALMAWLQDIPQAPQPPGEAGGA